MRVVVATGQTLRLIFLGRGTEEATQEIDRAFKGVPIEVVNFGLQSASEVSRILAGADAMLCVRGKLFPRRGSAVAGIACGLPIVGYAGSAENTHLMDAGVQLVPYQDRDALGAALARVLSDETLRSALRDKSLRAHERYFSWNGIAAAFIKWLGPTRS
jgi:glycosyltransferase involved in cell wall biosynthesis